MEQTAKFAGYFASHAIWSILDDSDLVTIFATEMPDGSYKTARLVANDSKQAMDIGQHMLEENQQGANNAVLIVDAIANFDGERYDALFIMAKNYESNGSFTVVVPYSHSDSDTGIMIHPAQLTNHEGFDINFTREILDPFFEGVDSHEQGAAIWNQSMA